MAKKIDQKELIDLFVQFLNETGMFYSFKEFIEKMGYQLKELGIEED